MPELPEVQVTADVLRAQLVGQRIADATVYWARSIAIPDAKTFVRTLRGRMIRDVQRRGKFIVMPLCPGKVLLIHLRMSGQLLLEHAQNASQADPHTRVQITMTSGQVLRFRDQRKFGRWYLVDEVTPIVGDLGPEPLSEAFTPEALGGILRHRRRQIKPLLLDQRIVAGLGNIYVDEALWQARIHPLRNAHTLTNDELHRLHEAIRCVLNQAILHKGTTLRDYRTPQNETGEHLAWLAVRNRAGEPCLRCGQPLARTIVGGRGTFLCPACQPFPTILHHPEEELHGAHSGD